MDCIINTDREVFLTSHAVLNVAFGKKTLERRKRNWSNSTPNKNTQERAGELRHLSSF